MGKPLRQSDVESLASGIDRLANSLRREAPARVSISTISALDRLRLEGPLRVSELAARELMTQPGVTILINRLAEAGYAVRVPDPTDGRATLVRITDAGLAVLAERHAARTRVLRQRLARLSDDDRELLTAALPAVERLASSAPAAPGASGGPPTPRAPCLS
ncbi:MarR family winged helix-turn-helix transcriptional regulator [uncultured Jatrophihabitans sp.]|uniref:MarR family winged helix-turn-helix transcriptional regulator n=1 Tax=uncultured Jatrophihabitans sp. TaxID=1610747 RepID=UPI0035CB282B